MFTQGKKYESYEYVFLFKPDSATRGGRVEETCLKSASREPLRCQVPTLELGAKAGRVLGCVNPASQSLSAGESTQPNAHSFAHLDE